MKKIIVLAMHGVPPTDFPEHELGELFSLHGRLERATRDECAVLERRHAELETRVREWPRSAENDPFYAGSQKLAAELSKASGHEVILGFNEFCGPSIEEALELAIERGAEQLLVITPMMTRGGEHSEHDIPSVITQVQVRHPGVQLIYAWPFEASDVARFLAGHLNHFA